MQPYTSILPRNSAWSLTPSFSIDTLSTTTSTPIQYVLLQGGCQIGHTLRTLSERCLQQQQSSSSTTSSSSSSSTSSSSSSYRPLHAYTLHNTPESIARHIILLSIAYDQRLSIEERSELFLEIYGNILLRSKTHELLIQHAHWLRSFICFESPPSQQQQQSNPCIASLHKIIDMSQLKFRERDQIENVFTQWIQSAAQGENLGCEIKTMHDTRLRQYFGERYDARWNLFDWDYVMAIRKEAPILHSYHYKRWRSTGQAFELREATYSIANPTLLSKQYSHNKSKAHSDVARSLECDILVSPFVSFGVECKETRFFNKRSQEFIYNSVDVSRFNLRSMLKHLDGTGEYKMESTACELAPNKDSVSASIPKIELMNDDNTHQNTTLDGQNNSKLSSLGDKLSTDASSIGCALAKMSSEHINPRMRIIMMLGNASTVMNDKPRFRHRFETVFLPLSASSTLDSQLVTLLAPQARVMIENVCFLPTMKSDDKIKFVQNALQMASEINLHYVNFNKDKSSQQTCDVKTIDIPELVHQRVLTFVNSNLNGFK